VTICCQYARQKEIVGPGAQAAERCREAPWVAERGPRWRADQLTAACR
jgi:hypothetical protein